ncbi:MAG: glycosyltransferase family 2 protein [Oscillospiraceae bacterium]|nr:glycosyltransferase family 2 protein [Oscillospiraceae bacterium]
MTLLTLWIVVPCFNEEEVLPETASRLSALMKELMYENRISGESRVCFVNDGSADSTWEKIRSLHESDPLFAGLCLSRNRGHQNALLAGLMLARTHADAVISMDADLQDDPGAVRAFLEQYENGCDIVYGVRSSRASDSFFKRSSAESFYRLMKFLGAELVFNHADYRLMSRRALDALAEYEEVNLFLRGIAPQLGFRSACVEYERAERFAGKSKYPLKKMLSFAFDGVSSFSVRPLRAALVLGGAAFAVSIVILIYCLIRHLCGKTVSGWTSLGVSIWALGGLQLLMIGVVGEYVGKVYLETKKRPRYIIEETLL